MGQNKKYLNGKWSYLFNATILGNEKGAEAPVRLYPGAPQSPSRASVMEIMNVPINLGGNNFA